MAINKVIRIILQLLEWWNIFMYLVKFHVKKWVLKHDSEDSTTTSVLVKSYQSCFIIRSTNTRRTLVLIVCACAMLDFTIEEYIGGDGFTAIFCGPILAISCAFLSNNVHY